MMRMKSKRALSLALCAAIMLTVVNAVIAGGMLFSVRAEEYMPYKDTSLTFKERAADLISRMTLAQKQSLMGDSNSGVPSLGVSSVNFWNEALHGVANHNNGTEPHNRGYTSFPSPNSMASSWNDELMGRISTIISDEARALNNELQTNSIRLSYFSPTINIGRDTRWGRNEESYSEDVFLTSAMGRQFINGMQGTNDNANLSPSGEKYYKLITTLKHYALNNTENIRHNGSSNSDDRSIRNYYTKAFKNIVETTRTGAVMSGYNCVNGIPMSANEYLLTTMLRQHWGFDGYVVSDCGAFKNMVEDHKWVPEGADHSVTPAEATAYGILYGGNMSCGDYHAKETYTAVNAGLLTEDDVDNSLLEIMIKRFQTGEFDPKEDVDYRNIKADIIESETSFETSLESSRQSIVMLKNDKRYLSDDKILPINISGMGTSQVKSIAVYGPLVRHAELGHYSGGSYTQTVNFKQGMIRYLKSQGFITDEQIPDEDQWVEENGTLDFFEGLGGNSARHGNIINFRAISFNGTLPLTGALGSASTYGTDGPFSRRGVNADELYPAGGEAGGAIRKQGTDPGQLGFITQGNYAVYKEMNVTNLSKVDVVISSPASNNTTVAVALHVGSSTGPVIATVKCRATNGWDDYQVRTCTEIDLQGYTGLQDIYITFNYLEDDTDSLDMEAIEKAKDYDLAIVYTGTTALRPETAPPYYIYIEDSQGEYIKKDSTTYEKSTGTGIDGKRYSKSYDNNGEIVRNADGKPIQAEGVNGFSVAAEGHDRDTLVMPRAQGSLINEVAKVNPNTIAIIHAVGPVDISKFKDNVKAIMYSAYNGQFQGTAMVDNLFGIHNPGGRLTQTWYKGDYQMPDSTNYNLYPDYSNTEDNDKNGRTYMYFRGQADYPFGYGLSYTTYSYSNIKLKNDITAITAGEKFTVTLDVTKTGAMKGAEIVQVYIALPGAGTNDIPIKELKGFKRVEFEANETTKSVEIEIDSSDFSFVYKNEDGSDTDRIIKDGTYQVIVGMSSEDIKATMPIEVTATAPKLQNVTLKGDKVHSLVGKSFGSKITLSMSNEVFLDPADESIEKIEYMSTRENVAEVDDDGVVTTVGGGTTLIKAIVTMKDGVILEDDFPVAVKDVPYVDDIKIDGVSLERFNYATYKYTHMLSGGSSDVPVITLDVPEGIGMGYSIDMPAKIPGNAVITVTRGEMEVQYVIKLLAAPESEEYIVAKFTGLERTYHAPAKRTDGQTNSIPSHPAYNGTDYWYKAASITANPTDPTKWELEQRNLYADWSWVNNSNGTYIDLMKHDPDKLYLRFNVNLTIDKKNPSLSDADIDKYAFQTGTAKLRSRDLHNKEGDPEAGITPGTGNQEHNFGWNISSGNWNLQAGDNFIEIPLSQAIYEVPYGTITTIGGRTYNNLQTNKKGVIDWEEIGRMIFIIDSVSKDELYESYSGGQKNLPKVAFSMTLSDVMIVDVTMEELDNQIQDMTTNLLAPDDYTYDSYDDYLAAVEVAKTKAGTAVTTDQKRALIKELEDAVKLLEDISGFTGHIRIGFDPQALDATPQEFTIIEKYNGDLYELPVVTRPGYILDGWYTKPEGGTKITAESKVKATRNHDLYAHWVSETATDRKKGDVTGDGNINIFDIMLIRDHIFGKITLTGEDDWAANVNGDDGVNIFDIMLIRDHIFGKRLLD